MSLSLSLSLNDLSREFFYSKFKRHHLYPHPISIASNPNPHPNPLDEKRPHLYRQYILTTHEDISKFPSQNKGYVELSKRIKGISRTKHTNITYLDFQKVVTENVPSRKTLIASLKRQNFCVHLIQTRKKTLSKFNSKRCFSDKFRTKNSFFSFPIHLRVLKLIE